MIARNSRTLTVMLAFASIVGAMGGAAGATGPDLVPLAVRVAAETGNLQQPPQDFAVAGVPQRWEVNVKGAEMFGGWDVVSENGCGRPDFVIIRDFDGDSKADAFERRVDGTSRVANGAANGFGAWIDLGSAGDTAWEDMRFADFDGDGRADVYRRLADGRWQLNFMNDAGTSFGAWVDVASQRSLTAPSAVTTPLAESGRA